ncbi:unnamed protein product [Rhizophagus irregularis]|nr:unnamed protein product [Rhizophagus irregularis]
MDETDKKLSVRDLWRKSKCRIDNVIKASRRISDEKMEEDAGKIFYYLYEVVTAYLYMSYTIPIIISSIEPHVSQDMPNFFKQEKEVPSQSEDQPHQDKTSPYALYENDTHYTIVIYTPCIISMITINY